VFRESRRRKSPSRVLIDVWGIAAKLTGTQDQQGHTRPRPNPYPDPKFNPKALTLNISGP